MLRCGLVRLAAKRGAFALIPAVDANAGWERALNAGSRTGPRCSCAMASLDLEVERGVTRPGGRARRHALLHLHPMRQNAHPSSLSHLC
jgi:hypothetical protein